MFHVILKESAKNHADSLVSEPDSLQFAKNRYYHMVNIGG